MKNERRTFWPLLALLMALLTATLFLTLKLDRKPAMQRPAPDIVYPEHVELEKILQEVLELMRSGKLTAAQSLLTAALKEHPDNSDVWMLRGSVYYRQELFDRAAHAFAVVEQQQPDNAAASNNLAESLIRLQRFDEARAAIARAVKLLPDNGEILLNAAGLHALLHDDKAALFFLKKAMENGITPEMISMHRELVKLLERPEFMEYYKSQQNKKQPRK